MNEQNETDERIRWAMNIAAKTRDQYTLVRLFIAMYQSADEGLSALELTTQWGRFDEWEKKMSEVVLPLVIKRAKGFIAAYEAKHADTALAEEQAVIRKQFGIKEALNLLETLGDGGPKGEVSYAVKHYMRLIRQCLKALDNAIEDDDIGYAEFIADNITKHAATLRLATYKMRTVADDKKEESSA